jgi:hypothetical protein
MMYAGYAEKSAYGCQVDGMSVNNPNEVDGAKGGGLQVLRTRA